MKTKDFNDPAGDMATQAVLYLFETSRTTVFMMVSFVTQPSPSGMAAFIIDGYLLAYVRIYGATIVFPLGWVTKPGRAVSAERSVGVPGLCWHQNWSS